MTTAIDHTEYVLWYTEASKVLFILYQNRHFLNIPDITLTNIDTSLLFHPKLLVRAFTSALCWLSSRSRTNSFCSSTGISLTCQAKYHGTKFAKYI